MRDLLLTLPALVLPATQRPDPASQRLGTTTAPEALADVPGFVSDVERRFAALESYCAELRTVPPRDPEFDRLDRLVTEAVHALVDAPARDIAGLRAKAHALIHCPAIEEDDERSERVGASLARDVLRLFAPTTRTGDHHA